MSYVIRNCPCLEQSDIDKDIYNSCLGATDYIGMCKDCTDCVMKQIVEKCKDAQSECSCKNAIKDVDCFECTSGGRAELGTDILQLLQIEEVE